MLRRQVRVPKHTPGAGIVPGHRRADAKWFAASDLTKNVYRFTAVRVESAADSARWHGVNERVLVTEYAKAIGFFHQFLVNAQDL